MIELFEQELPNNSSQLILTILKHFRELLDQGMNTRLELHPVLARNAPDLVAGSGDLADALTPNPVNALQVLLQDRLDRHRMKLRTLRCLDNGQRITSITLSTTNERLQVLGRNEYDLVAHAFELSAPVVAAGTGFHRHLGWPLFRHHACQPGTAHLVVENQLSCLVDGADLKDVLCQVDSNQFMLHVDASYVIDCVEYQSGANRRRCE